MLFQMMTGLECGHSYCTSCWTEYLSTKIMDEGASQMIECPGSNCDILVDDQTVMKLVKEAKVKLKYQQLITNSFVQVMIKETEVNETINLRKNFNIKKFREIAT